MSRCCMCHVEFATHQLQYLKRGQRSLHALTQVLVYVPIVVFGFLSGQMEFSSVVPNLSGTHPALYCHNCIDWIPTRLLLALLFVAVFCAAAYRATIWYHGLVAQ